jgi:primosomal protein N' (replication factor Y)
MCFMSNTRQYYLVAPLAFTGADGVGVFTYRTEGAVAAGSVVEVPIGRRKSLGVVIDATERPEFTTRAVIRTLDVPPLPEYVLRLAAWMADYYAASPAAVWSNILPAGLGKKRRGKEGEAAAEPMPVHLPADPLTTEQAATLAAISGSDRQNHLVQGVTGSGKTRLYLELAAKALAASRSVIILVPEITLTPQITAQFEAAFGTAVLATHSKLTEAQRERVWQAASAATAAGRPRVVVGPRSCLFLPLYHLGLIVVDECHESSYKQDNHPRYHALTVAAKLGALTGARVVFGSATPGLNELFLARQQRLQLHTLTERVLNKPLPIAHIVDLRDKSLRKASKFLAQPLIEAINDTFAGHRQSLLYLNRRGSASSQICDDCGRVTACPTCQLPLTFHADFLRLICHHCGHRAVVPAVCPDCSGASLKLLGGGTKRIEAEVQRLWPAARLARIDRDSTTTAARIHELYRQISQGEIDIIIGTQMIAKGLDLPDVDVVGVVSADTMLHLPDFAAAERTFQLLTQVSGRAGRGDRPGQVFIQTYNPTHPAITASAHYDFPSFAEPELAARYSLGYPPYSYLLKLTVTTQNQADAIAEATDFAASLRQHPGLNVSGPAPAFLETVGGHYRWVISVASRRRPPLVQIARQLPGAHWSADLDPLNLL